MGPKSENGHPPPSVFEIRSVSIRIGPSAERRKNFFGARKKTASPVFSRAFAKPRPELIEQNPLKFRQFRQSKLSSLAARYVVVQDCLLSAARGAAKKIFPKKFFRAEKFGVPPVFFRVFAYRRRRRTGVVLPEKGPKPKNGPPLRVFLRSVPLVSE